MTEIMDMKIPNSKELAPHSVGLFAKFKGRQPHHYMCLQPGPGMTHTYRDYATISLIGQSKVAALKEDIPKAEAAVTRLLPFVSHKADDVDAEMFQAVVADEKQLVSEVETNVKDAKRRISLHKGPSKNKKAADLE